jgi:hypothetical protein
VFLTTMVIDSGLNSVLTLIATYRQRPRRSLHVGATLQLIVETTVVTEIDICHIMFGFDWFIANIVDLNFAWTDFSRNVYVADKRARSVSKSAKTITPEVTTTTPVSSTLDFSDDVLLTDVKHQVTPPTPRTTGTLKPHKL